MLFNCRYVFLAGAIGYQVGFKNNDRYYTPLPLYHTAGGAMAIGQAILYGSCVVIRKKFSASNYFSDISKYKCTVSIKSIFLISQKIKVLKLSLDNRWMFGYLFLYYILCSNNNAKLNTSLCYMCVYFCRFYDSL